MSIYNIEAEQSVLGAVIMDPGKILQCRKQNLKVEDFFYFQHQIIYIAINKLFDNRVPLDTITLINELRMNGQLDKVGGLNYILNLPNIVPTSENIDYYIRIVLDLSIRRLFISNLGTLKNAAESMDIQELIHSYDSIKNTLHANTIVNELFEDGTELDFSREPAPALSTGFECIDEVCGNGLVYGSLTVITGYTGAGKSTFVNQLIAQAISQGVGAFLYSGELSSDMIMRMLVDTIANEEDLLEEISSIQNTTHVTEEGIEIIYSWLRSKIFLFSRLAVANEQNLSITIEQLATDKNVRFIVIDNLMTLDMSGNDKYDKQINAVKTLKRLATLYNLVIILVAHPNKGSRHDNKPVVFSISGASEVPNMADYVFNIARNEDNSSKITIMKNRILGIQNKSFKLYFNPVRRRFYSKGEAELVRDFGYRSNIGNER